MLSKKKKYTKWIPLGNFSHDSCDYMTFVRKNLITGMLGFKTKKVNGWLTDFSCVSRVLPNNLIDTKKAWGEIQNAK